MKNNALEYVDGQIVAARERTESAMDAALDALTENDAETQCGKLLSAILCLRDEIRLLQLRNEVKER